MRAGKQIVFLLFVVVAVNGFVNAGEEKAVAAENKQPKGGEIVLKLNFNSDPNNQVYNELNKVGDVQIKIENQVKVIKIKGDPKKRAQVSLFISVRQIDDAKTHFKIEFAVKKEDKGDKKLKLLMMKPLLYNNGNVLLERPELSKKVIEKKENGWEKWTYYADSDTEDWDGHLCQFRIYIFVDKGDAQKDYVVSIDNIVITQLAASEKEK